MVSTREQLHQLVDRISDADLAAAKRELERLAPRSKLAEFLANAPLDDDELTAEELDAIDEGLQAIAEGRVISDSELEDRLAARSAKGE